MERADIPVFKPYLGPDTLNAVANAFDVGWIGMGATTKAFEEALQRTLHTDRHVVATMTGSAALHIALLLAGVKPGDEVILPSFNYIADVQAILWCGAKPVFCDIEEKTFGIDVSQIEELITTRTRAIMPLHFAGRASDCAMITDIATRHGLRIVEDATHAFGSSYQGRPIGSSGDIAAFSFDPVKLITCLDGGAVVCSQHEDIAVLHRLRLLGVDKDTAERYKNQRAWEYDVTGIGYRAHMTNINAAIGLSQLARLDEFVANRRQYCRAYDDAFAAIDWLTLSEVNWDEVGPFIYTIRVGDSQRELFIQHMRQCGVATGIHFLPCHTMTLCRDFPRGRMDATERISSEIVTLPLWSFMPNDVLARIMNAVRSFTPARKLVATA